jgi:putative oxidoreductase
MIPKQGKADVGLLILRVVPGSMLFFAHGLQKLMSVPGIFERFPDPIGVGHTASAVLAIFSETVCAVAVALGLFTRLAAVPVVIMLLVAGFIVHSADPWAKKEFAFVYCIPFLTLVFTGGGRFALDAIIAQWKLRPPVDISEA